MVQTYAVIVDVNDAGRMKTILISDLPKDIAEPNILWKAKARTAEEAEDKFLRFFCPQNTAFIKP